MFRYIFVLVLAVQQAPQDEVHDLLASASSLYYEAKFKESIDLLAPLDEKLHSEDGRAHDKAGIKLQLALAYVALNDATQARSRFEELYSIDPDYALDMQQYPPKVVSLAEEAKAAQ